MSINQHQVVTDETKAAVLADYRRGDLCRDIAERHGVSRSFVSMAAHKAGVSRSKRWPASPNMLTGGAWVYGRDMVARWVEGATEVSQA